MGSDARLVRAAQELRRRLDPQTAAEELGVSPAEVSAGAWDRALGAPDAEWRVRRAALRRGFFDLLKDAGIEPVAYDLLSAVDLAAEPPDIDVDISSLPMHTRATTIAGHRVDFPLGIPASILASNAKWIRFFAQRGFDVLTYKTVRTQFRAGHQWPHWVFIEDPVAIRDEARRFHGSPSYWPANLENVTMANSFGVPSLGPDWWMDDIRKARAYVREGHQVLIVSVISSVETSEDALIADFVDAALMAKHAGADIVEANLSCPNVPGEGVGEVYEDAELAGRVAAAIKEAISPTPLFIKIRYLDREGLRHLLTHTTESVDGVVAINTLQAEVFDEDGEPTFPGRRHAGVSGWAIRGAALESARNLVELRATLQLENRLDIIGVGGVTSPAHVYEFLDHVGVDAVQTCTGAFLNPSLAIETRLEEGREEIGGHRSRVSREWEFLKKFVTEVFGHPSETSRIRVDPTGDVRVDRTARSRHRQRA